MTLTDVQTIGFIGAGNIGSNVAAAVIGAGYDVVIANSRGPETLTDLIDRLGPKSRATTADAAAAAGDLVVVAVPVNAIGDLPVAPLVGKIVIDTNNYYPARDGHHPELDARRMGAPRRPAADRRLGGG